MPKQADINFRLIVKFIGILLMILSGFILLSAVWSIYYEEPIATRAIFLSCGITLLSGFILFILTRRYDHRNIGKKEGYIIVTFTWIGISIFGSLPFYLSGAIPSYTDAFFETISGFTTTGATILEDIEVVSKGLLFWRSLTQWLGGVGIIVLTLAILPILGVGGMQLFIAEAPGTTPNRLHPRIKETAKRLWGIYFSLTIILLILLNISGMNFFESFCHALTTMSTGGFSPKNDSIAGYSSIIQYVIILFMIIAGINFALHYFLIKGKFDKFFRNDELRFYLIIIASFPLIFTVTVFFLHDTNLEESFRHSLFQIVTIVTTTGYISTDYLLWKEFLWFALFLLMFAGGCIGSTSGGIKMIRHLVLLKNTSLEFKRLIHPMAVIPVRINAKPIPKEIIQNFLAFFSIYVLVFAAGSAIMTVMGLDFISAVGSVAATIGNVGPGIGSVGPVDNYAHIPVAGKWFLSFLMLLGRLELFTVLLLFLRAFWRN